MNPLIVCFCCVPELKSVKFNEEVDVKTIEPVPEVLEIDEVINLRLSKYMRSCF